MRKLLRAGLDTGCRSGHPRNCVHSRGNVGSVDPVNLLVPCDRWAPVISLRGLTRFRTSTRVSIHAAAAGRP